MNNRIPVYNRAMNMNIRYELIESDPTRKLIYISDTPTLTVPRESSWEAIRELLEQLGYECSPDPL